MRFACGDSQVPSNGARTFNSASCFANPLELIFTQLDFLIVNLHRRLFLSTCNATFNLQLLFLSYERFFTGKQFTIDAFQQNLLILADLAAAGKHIVYKTAFTGVKRPLCEQARQCPLPGYDPENP